MPCCAGGAGRTVELDNRLSLLDDVCIVGEPSQSPGPRAFACRATNRMRKLVQIVAQ
jgi:hypothetical protein